MKDIILFKDMTSEELDYLASLLSIVHFPIHHTIIEQGKTAEGLFIIKEGYVMVTTRLPGDLTTNVTTLADNEFFSETALVNKQLNLVSVRALGNTECYFLKREVFDALRLLKPLLAHKLLVAINEEVCCRLRKIYQKVAGRLVDIDSESWVSKKTTMQYQKTNRRALDKIGINKDFLLSLAGFRGLTEKSLEKLFSYVKLLALPKYTVLFKENSNSDTFYIVLQGAFLNNVAKEKKLSKVSVVGPGGLVGHISFVDNGKRAMTSVARESAVLLEMSRDSFLKLKEKDPELFYQWYYIITQALAAELYPANKLLIRLTSEILDKDTDSTDFLIVR